MSSDHRHLLEVREILLELSLLLEILDISGKGFVNIRDNVVALPDRVASAICSSAPEFALQHVAIGGEKGGTGKSPIATNLAARFGRYQDILIERLCGA